jgi:nifR3 family TIM-barrel protein
MQVKSVNIPNLKIENNVFLAPMAGFTDYSFRNLALKCGYGFCFTELVSAKGMFFNSKGTELLLFSGQDIKKTGVQLFGADEYYMRRACEDERLKDFPLIDINMGCPVPKVFNNGEGSALLKDIKKAEKIIKECVKSGKNISIKIRIGQKKGDDIATDFTKMAEDNGAIMVTIHGRVREDYYSGEPDYKAIYNAKKAVKIPVIANGGIFTTQDADKMMNETGADGVMIARGAISNVHLINEILNTNPSISVKEFIFSQLDGMQYRYGEKRANLEFRKFAPYYLKGINNIKDKKLKLQTANSVNEIKEIINQIF